MLSILLVYLYAHVMILCSGQAATVWFVVRTIPNTLQRFAHSSIPLQRRFGFLNLCLSGVSIVIILIQFTELMGVIGS